MSFDDEQPTKQVYSNDPNFAKTEVKRQNYHMNELEKQLKQLQRLSNFEVDFDYKKVNEVIIKNATKIKVNSLDVIGEDITYKDVIMEMAKSNVFTEFDNQVLVDFDINETNLIACFIS